MLAPVTHILPLTAIRRERLLKVPGKVVVRKGQKVSAADPVAETNLAPEHLMLDVARGLGMNADAADRHIKVEVGAQVAEGDVIAGPVGLMRRVMRSPRGARVVLAGSGQVLLEVDGKPFSLKAGISGDVVELVPERGAIVETTGALIQGVWGNGQVDFGLMYVLLKTPDQVLTHDRLDVSLRGSIVLAGHCSDPEALRTAAELPLRGLILASLDPALVSAAAKLPLPVLVIDGFGQIPMNMAAFKLLTTNERREVAVNAEPWNRYEGTRPEVTIPLPAPGGTPSPRETDFFSAGQQVRVIGRPYFSQSGTLVDLLGPVILPSGVRAPGAQVRLDDGTDVTLPLANLEVLG